MNGGLAQVIEKRQRSWTLLHQGASTVNDYFEQVPSSTEELSFYGFDVPSKGEWVNIGAVGKLKRGDATLFVDEEKLEFDASYFMPDVLLKDADGVKWGVLTVKRFGDRITPTASTATQLIELEIERKGLQE